jgi:MFS family permease
MEIPDRSDRPLPLGWLIVALLVPVALLNYMDRQLLAAMKTSVMADIPSIGTNANWGMLPAAFKWVYALFSPIGGYLADKFSRRHVIIFSLIVWSILTWSTGICQTYHQLLATRALMGISEACYIPAALAMIADYHVGHTRSRAVGIHQMGIYLGIIIAGFSGYVAEDVRLTQWVIGVFGALGLNLGLDSAAPLGWRLAFEASGIIGLLYSVPLLLRLKNPPSRRELDAPSLSMGKSLRTLFGSRGFVLLIICFTLPALSGWLVKDWMAPILKDKFGIGQGMAGVSATLYVNIASILGVVAGGFLADRLVRHTIRGRIFVSAAGLLLLGPALFGVGLAPTLAVAVSCLFLFGLGWGFYDCNNMPILGQLVPAELRATGYGFMNLVSISFGGLADVAFGILTDFNIPLKYSLALYGGCAWIAAMLLLRIRPRQIPT